MSERFVINLSGKRGEGPWLSKKTGGVYPTPNFQGATSADSEGLAVTTAHARPARTFARSGVGPKSQR